MGENTQATAHDHHDGRVPEPIQIKDHANRRTEDPCMTKYSPGRDERDDLLDQDPFDPAYEERVKAERGDYPGAYNGGGLHILGRNATLDQAWKANKFF